MYLANGELDKKQWKKSSLGTFLSLSIVIISITQSSLKDDYITLKSNIPISIEPNGCIHVLHRIEMIDFFRAGIMAEVVVMNHIVTVRFTGVSHVILIMCHSNPKWRSQTIAITWMTIPITKVTHLYTVIVRAVKHLGMYEIWFSDNIDGFTSKVHIFIF